VQIEWDILCVYVGTIRRICLSSYDLFWDNSLVQGLIRVDFFLIFKVFVLALADGLCCACVLYHIWFWYRCPEIGTSSTDLSQLSTFYLKTETESSLRNVAVLNKNMAMGIVEKHYICINIPSSQTF
jgi:hypothetical protein